MSSQMVRAAAIIGDLLEVTFAINTSLSNAIDRRHRSALGIFSDAAWTAAALTAQVSDDGVTWYNVYDRYGTEWTCQLATDARRFVPLDIGDWASGRYIRFRSGTAATPVNQTAARELHLLVRPV